MLLPRRFAPTFVPAFACVAPFAASLVTNRGVARADACPPSLVALEARWEASRTGPVAGIVAREAAMAEADAALAREADLAFDRSGAGAPLPPASCLGREAFRSRCLDAINAAFFARTLSVLRAEGGASSRAFERAVRQEFGPSSLSGFQVSSEWVPAGTALPAGFDRGSGAAFVRLGSLAAGAWYVYVVHEMAHALGPALKKAERANARAVPVAADIVAWSAGGPSAATARQRELATAFARVDMERGYLSEVRAWKNTFDVLAELPPTVVPGEQVRFLATPFGSVRRFSYDEIHAKLLPRFAVDDAGLYSNVLAREGLLAARGELTAEVEKGGHAVVDRSKAAFTTLEAALAR